MVEDRRMEEGGLPRAGGVAVGVEGVITAALRRWTETGCQCESQDEE